MSQAQDLYFRSFRLDATKERLWRGAREITLRPKTFAVLRYFVEHAGRLITKDELLDAVWPDTSVSDVVPIVCVRELRQALGDHPDTPRFIETVPRRGYRFIAPLTTTPMAGQNAKIKMQKAKLEPGLSLPQLSSLKPLVSSLVGRESELAYLHKLLANAYGGERQVVFISGETGIGKTAFIDTFLGSLAPRPGSPEESQKSHRKSHIAKVSETQSSVLSPQSLPFPNPPSLIPAPWVAYGQCIEQHGAGEAYLPLLDVTGHLCRGPGGEQLVEVLRQYAPTWLLQFPSVLSDADFEDIQKKTLGTTQERMLREMAEATEALTTIRPLILILEDLHWCDSATLDFLAFLARRRGPARLLVIGTYRPASVVSGSSLFSSLKQDLALHHHCEEMTLPLLSIPEVATYLEMQLPPERRHGIPLLPLADRIHQRADGNPLFLVNVVDYLIAHGGGNGIKTLESFEQLLQMVPESLQQMIEKQIERLSPEDQEMLEVASVAGVEFSAAALASALESDVVVVERRCRELVRREQFLCERGVEEWPDATVATRYGFIHSLYQQVLYQRVTGARSARLHIRIGTRIEEGYGAQARENAAVLATHFMHGRDYHRAVQYLQYAAENAVWRCALPEAHAYFAKGVELLHHWPDTPERTQQELVFHLIVLGPLMAAKGEASPEIEYVYEQIVKLHRRLGTTETPLLVLLGLWMVRLVRGELLAAQDIAAQMMARAESEGEPIMHMFAHLTVGICAFYRGEFSLAHGHFQQGLALYDTQDHPQYLLDPKMLGLSLDSHTVWMLGHPELAAQHSYNAVAWAHQVSHPYNGVAALAVAAWLSANRREGARAEKQVEELLQTAQRYGFIQYVTLGLFLRGCVSDNGQPEDEGVRLMFQGIEAMHAAKFGVGMSAWQGLLAAALGKQGRTDEALALLAQAEAVMESSGERFFEAELYRIKGELTLAGAGSSSQQAPSLKPLVSSEAEREAEEYFLKAIAIARQQQAKSFELRAAMNLVRVRTQQMTRHASRDTHHDTYARLDEAHRMLSEVYNWFTEGFDTPDLQEARQLLEEGGKSLDA